MNETGISPFVVVGSYTDYFKRSINTLKDCLKKQAEPRANFLIFAIIIQSGDQMNSVCF